jgi:hypothetical protein
MTFLLLLRLLLACPLLITGLLFNLFVLTKNNYVKIIKECSLQSSCAGKPINNWNHRFPVYLGKEIFITVFRIRDILVRICS